MMILHTVFSRHLLQQIALSHPTEPLMQVHGKDLAGAELVKYLDTLPAVHLWICDCPRPKLNGDCGCTLAGKEDMELA